MQPNQLLLQLLSFIISHQVRTDHDRCYDVTLITLCTLQLPWSTARPLGRLRCVRRGLRPAGGRPDRGRGRGKLGESHSGVKDKVPTWRATEELSSLEAAADI